MTLRCLPVKKASLVGVSTTLPKANPRVICFTAAPSPSKHRPSYQVNQLLSDMNRRAERSHMTTSSIISNVSPTAKKKKKMHLVPDSQRVFAAAYQLPSDSFTCNVQFCVGFKGNLTYIQTRKWIRRCHFSVSFCLPLSVSKAWTGVKTESFLLLSIQLEFSWGGHHAVQTICILIGVHWKFPHGTLRPDALEKQHGIAIKKCIFFKTI